jgi:pantetheine-phosphate adenylyltransferase
MVSLRLLRAGSRSIPALDGLRCLLRARVLILLAAYFISFFNSLLVFQDATRDLSRLIRSCDERSSRYYRARLQTVRRNHHRHSRSSRQKPMFTIEERVEMLLQVTGEIDKGACVLRVDNFQGLLVKYAVEREAQAIVRGIRAISDYEYELQMALMNRRLEPRIETVFMMPHEDYSYVSSRLVKEVFGLGGAIDGLVPAFVMERMKRKSNGL